MTEQQAKKKIEALVLKSSTLCDYLQTLRELKGKAEQRKEEAHKMANYPNQKYAEDWAREENHQAKIIKQLEEMDKLFSDDLDQVCEKCEALRVRFNYWE